MATAAVLKDVESLLEPVSGENPAGRPLPRPARMELDEARKEFQQNPDNPEAAPVQRNVDWQGIILRCTEILTGTSKDLGVALRLLEALTKKYGYPGARDGFRLLKEMHIQCWDRMYPVPDPEYGEGMEVRAIPFEWINDPEMGARFPGTILDVPALKYGSTTYSVRDFERTVRPDKMDTPPIPLDQLKHLKLANPALMEDLAECLAEATALEAVLTEKLEKQAPGLAAKEALQNCQEVLKRFAGAAPASQAVANGDGDHPGTSVAVVNGLPGGSVNVANREEIYRVVEQAANVLERLEPHSPIPYLLRRAVALGHMPFNRLIRELVRNNDLLTEIEREFGIQKEPDAAAPES